MIQTKSACDQHEETMFKMLSRTLYRTIKRNGAGMKLKSMMVEKCIGTKHVGSCGFYVTILCVFVLLYSM